MTLLWALICTGIAAGMLRALREVLKLPEDASSSNQSSQTEGLGNVNKVDLSEETLRAEPHF